MKTMRFVFKFPLIWNNVAILGFFQLAMEAFKSFLVIIGAVPVWSRICILTREIAQPALTKYNLKYPPDDEVSKLNSTNCCKLQ
jgi:hypothetical protein